MFIKRRENGFNLAFLDVMACGLGAVLLILIIVTFNDDTPIPSDEIERLQQELAAVQNQSQSVLENLQQQQQQGVQQQLSSDDEASRIALLKIQQQALQQAISDERAIIADLQNAIAAVAPQTANDPIALPTVNEETYLLGLVVEGKNIGILIDTSASMTDEFLIDIIKRKISSADANKQAGPKWQRTVRIVKWMLARLPETSRVALVSYNERAQALGVQAISTASVSKSVEKLVSDVNTLVPQKGTNLHAGLQEIARLMPNMTDLYIITDGLPSLISSSSGFAGNRNCTPFINQQATITGQCRALVFNHTLRVSLLAGVRTNVILLPLEGDPQAAAFYWQWANFTGGTFISPAGTWP